MPVVAPPDFGRSVIPISRGADYSHHITTCPLPQILRPSYGPLEGRWDGGLTIGSPSPSLISILRPTHRSTVIEIFLSSLKHFQKEEIKFVVNAYLLRCVRIKRIEPILVVNTFKITISNCNDAPRFVFPCNCQLLCNHPLAKKHCCIKF